MEQDDDLDDMPVGNRFESLLSARSHSAGSRASRPVSAVIDLRGSRPNSAAIANEIEGFEDDFMVRGLGGLKVGGLGRGGQRVKHKHIHTHTHTHTHNL
jgi:hypothetical protein